MSNGDSVPDRLLTPVPNVLPEGYFQRWQVFVDGQSTEVHHVTFINEEQGLQLDWGSHPDGKWSQFCYRENHGGGVVSVPYAIAPNGAIYMGIVDARRPFRDPRPGTSVMEAPRGMRGKNEPVTVAAQRETEEETGHNASAGEFFELEGDGANPNSTFWVTFDSESGEPDGIRFAAVEVPFNKLVASEDDNLRLASGGEVDAFEGIKGCSFVPFNIRKIAGEGDMFLHTGALRLQAHLLDKYDNVTFNSGIMVVTI